MYVVFSANASLLLGSSRQHKRVYKQVKSWLLVSQRLMVAPKVAMGVTFLSLGCNKVWTVELFCGSAVVVVEWIEIKGVVTASA